MKTTGIVRRIDDLGRVVIPKEIRRTLDIKNGGPMAINVDGDIICLQKYEGGETLETAVEHLKNVFLATSTTFESHQKIINKISELESIIGGTK